MAALVVDVNWLGVAIGAILSFALGGFWYSKTLFGRRWAQGSHIDVVAGHPPAALSVQALGTFLLAWVVGIAVANDNWWFAVLIILTVALTLAGGCLFSRKDGFAVLVETGFVLVNGAIMLAAQFVL